MVERGTTTLSPALTTLDWIIIGFTVLMAAWGYAQGLIVGALSLGGFAAGAFLGSRLGPLVLEEGSESPYAPLSALVGAVLVGGILASLFELLGFRLRGGLGQRLGLLDGVAGALLVGCLGLFLAWVGGAVALNTPGAGDLREPIQRSKILSELNESLPPSGPLIQALARFDPFPEIDGPEADVAPPNSKIARDPDVQRAAAGIVKVLGTACGLGVQGSGWVAAPGTVVTNAHVVAGQDDTTVQLRGEGDTEDAQAIWFDSRNDLAILRVPELDGARPLATNQNAERGTAGAILGFPQNGPYDVRPARLGQTTTVVTQDAYGRGPIERSITSVRGRVRSGNSGGPVVDAAGRVLTTIFAASVSNSGGSGFGVPDSIVSNALRRAESPVDTGPCA
jgi:Trypsin-like peptidase domain/Colicin V production protein